MNVLFICKVKTDETLSIVYEGYVVDLINKIQANLKFKYELEVVRSFTLKSKSIV